MRSFTGVRRRWIACRMPRHMGWHLATRVPRAGAPRTALGISEADRGIVGALHSRKLGRWSGRRALCRAASVVSCRPVCPGCTVRRRLGHDNRIEMAGAGRDQVRSCGHSARGWNSVGVFLTSNDGAAESGKAPIRRRLIWYLSSPFAKIFSLFFELKSLLSPAPSRAPRRGGSRSSRTLARDAVDAAACRDEAR